VDLTYYGLKLLQLLRIVWDVRTVPASARDAHLQTNEAGA
jgi:hypothetical protein